MPMPLRAVQCARAVHLYRGGGAWRNARCFAPPQQPAVRRRRIHRRPQPSIMRGALDSRDGPAEHLEGRSTGVLSMKIVRYRHDGRDGYGALEGDRITPLDGTIGSLVPGAGASPVALGAVHLLAPATPSII